MDENFTRMHRQLGKAVVWTLYGTLATYALAFIGALLGSSRMVESFRSVFLSVAIVFVLLFVLFLLSTLAAAILRRLTRVKAGS
jgi:hypothetical protein